MRKVRESGPLLWSGWLSSSSTATTLIMYKYRLTRKATLENSIHGDWSKFELLHTLKQSIKIAWYLSESNNINKLTIKNRYSWLFHKKIFFCNKMIQIAPWITAMIAWVFNQWLTSLILYLFDVQHWAGCLLGVNLARKYIFFFIWCTTLGRLFVGC